MFTLFTQFAAGSCTHDFLGLEPWYKYLNVGSQPNCDVSGFSNFQSFSHDVPLILAAVVDDLLRIAGIVAVAFVIVGAIKFIASQGNPESAASAQSTVINALIGLAIAITGAALINFIGLKLGG